eukprot:TRINITY_DN11855_c0_g2_i1.p1 TRINITY_DN11855_c0_g2~~TRINITY_DN11855_c0_g2_i1.p1  ORF type:complete len:561 (+),score=96.75 TRINITY_DN11855_c0_g2_i1:47-1684(+)
MVALAKARDNILFIASDDMRPEISPYGADYIHTPNLQELADAGFVFRRSYVQQALCAPSRTVFLTSRRPDTSRVWTIGPYFRDTTLHNVTTLPQFFKLNGYEAVGTGKIFHNGAPSGLIVKNGTIVRYGDDYPASWSEPYHLPLDDFDLWNSTIKGRPFAYEAIDAPWQQFKDGNSTTFAQNWLRNYTAHHQVAGAGDDTRLDKPFFLAVGFHRPHIPYVYPKQFDIYPDTIPFPPSDHKIPKGLPVMSMHDWSAEMGTYHNMDSDTLPLRQRGGYQNNLSALCTVMPSDQGMALKRAYWSSITYVDFLIGQLMTELKDLGLWNTTTIFFLGDHGYKLGEMCDWFKHDNKEAATRIPTLIKPSVATAKAKGIDMSGGTYIEDLVEEVDIFPSLVDLHGFDVPADLEGRSFVPLMAGVSGQDRMAVSQYPHTCTDIDNIEACRLHGKPYSGPTMGYSIRTQQWRYTEWTKWDCHDLMHPMNCTSYSPQWDNIVGRELYDHTNDPSTTTFDQFENVNLVDRSEYASVVKELSDLLHQHYPMDNSSLA